MSKKLSFENTRRAMERLAKESAIMRDIICQGFRESEEQARKEINKAIYDLAEKSGVSIYEICFHFSPRINQKHHIDDLNPLEFRTTIEYEIVLEPIEFEFEKGPGYWKNKYLRLKEKMREIIDDKNDGYNNEP